ncbi:hypothetical protein GIB67_002683, partial [Kingdonia uniflora]
YQIEAPTIGAPAVGAPAAVVPVIGSSFSATEIGAVVVRVCSQLEEHDNTLPLRDTTLLGHYQFSTPEKTAKRKREQKKEEYGKRKKAELGIKKKQVAPGEILEVANALMVDDVEVGREVNSNAISSEYDGDLLEWKKGEEKDNDVKKDVEEKVKSEEEVQELSTIFDATLLFVYLILLFVTMVVAEVAKIDIVFFNQEEVVGKTYQASANQTTAVSVEEQTLETKESKEEVEQNKEDEFEGKDDDDGNSQNKPDPEQVIDVYIKALIQYFDTQHHARPENERIVLTDIFAYQYIGRAFNVWTYNMSSPEGVELKKKSIWEQITSMQWDRTFSNCIYRGNLKVVNLELILIPWNINDSHWVLCVVSCKARKICIYDSMVDSKIANARKKKLSSGHRLIKDQISTILPKMLIWRDFAHRSRPPTGSEVKNYGLNPKWTTRFGKCPIQPNGNDGGVYMLVFMDNLLRGIKFLDLIDGNECRYTVANDILRLGIQPEEILF